MSRDIELPDVEEPDERDAVDRLLDEVIQEAKTCGNRFERPEGRQPGDRIVTCGMAPNHPGVDHEETDTGLTWPNTARKRDPKTFKLGDLVRVSCTATGRYLVDGWAMFVSAMSNDLCIDRATDEEPTEGLPVPTDHALSGALAMYFARSKVMSR